MLIRISCEIMLPSRRKILTINRHRPRRIPPDTLIRPRTRTKRRTPLRRASRIQMTSRTSTSLRRQPIHRRPRPRRRRIPTNTLSNPPPTIHIRNSLTQTPRIEMFARPRIIQPIHGDITSRLSQWYPYHTGNHCQPRHQQHEHGQQPNRLPPEQHRSHDRFPCRPLHTVASITVRLCTLLSSLLANLVLSDAGTTSIGEHIPLSEFDCH